MQIDDQEPRWNNYHETLTSFPLAIALMTTRYLTGEDKAIPCHGRHTAPVRRGRPVVICAAARPCPRRRRHVRRRRLLHRCEQHQQRYRNACPGQCWSRPKSFRSHRFHSPNRRSPRARILHSIGGAWTVRPVISPRPLGPVQHIDPCDTLRCAWYACEHPREEKRI